MKSLVNPRLWISVCNSKEVPVEVVQEIDTPAMVKTDSIWWGYTWHMQTPLENVGSDFSILVKFLHDGNTHAAANNLANVPTARYRINKETIDTMTSKFLLVAPAGAGGPPAGKKEVLPDVLDFTVEGEIIITKSFRHIDLDSLKA